jgi:threonine ammonia-lyase medium form
METAITPELTLVSLDDVRAAQVRLAGKVVRTPLLTSPELSAETGGEIRLKCESAQRIGAFKARGAINYVSQLSDAEASRGVITYSSGNHGQAVALAASLRGVRAVVVMPTTAPAVKSDGAKRLGAEVVFEGTTSIHRKVRAEAIAEVEGLVMVPPFDDPWIIAGQGTVGLEIVDEWPEVDTVVVPVGGGGLVSGVAASVRRLLPNARIFGVQPSGSDSMRRALDAGEPVVIDKIDTIADGLAPVRAGDLTFMHVRDLADDVVTVDDSHIRDAARFLLHRQKLVVEYSGAAGVAAVRSGKVDANGRRVAIVLSGGNLDPSILRELA